MFGFGSSTKFDPSTDLLDLSGKVIIVTGANRGIGLPTVMHLARKGAKVYLGSRIEENARAAIELLHAQGVAPGEVVYLPCDLSTPQSANRAGEEFLKREERLDVLVNNAAFMDILTTDKPTEDGISQRMMTNHIGTFVLTQTLLPLLIKTSQEPNSDVRIVTVSSGSHKIPRFNDPNIHFNSIDDFKLLYSNDIMPALSRYSASKLANILFSAQLQRRLASEPQSTNITCISLHPGGADTVSPTLSRPLSWLLGPFLWLFLKQPEEGAYTSCFAAASPVVKEDREKYKGVYLEPVGVIMDPSKNAQRKDLAEDLWKTTETYLEGAGLTFA